MPPYLVCPPTALSRRHTLRSFNFPSWPLPAPVTASPLRFRATTRPPSKPPGSSWGRLPSSRRTILRPVGGRETSSTMTTPRLRQNRRQKNCLKGPQNTKSWLKPGSLRTTRNTNLNGRLLAAPLPRSWSETQQYLWSRSECPLFPVPDVGPIFGPGEQQPPRDAA